MCPQESIFPQLLQRQLRAISSVDVYAVMWSQARVIPYSLSWSRHCSHYMRWTQKYKSKALLLNISTEVKKWGLEIANPGMIWVEEDRITGNTIFNLLLMNKLIPSFAQVHRGQPWKQFDISSPGSYSASDTTQGTGKSGTCCPAFIYICSQRAWEFLCPLRKQALESKLIPYPVVLLNLPVTGEAQHMLCLRAVWKLEKAGKHPSVLLGIRENRLLEVDSVWQEEVVLIHSGTQIAQAALCENEQHSLSCRSHLSYFSLAQQKVTQTFRWQVALSSPGTKVTKMTISTIRTGSDSSCKDQTGSLHPADARETPRRRRICILGHNFYWICITMPLSPEFKQSFKQSINNLCQ